MKEFDHKFTFKPMIAQGGPPGQDGTPGTSAPAPGSDGTTTPPAQGNNSFFFIYLILMFVVMYFVLIRPQQKKMKEHEKILTKLSPGDEIVTSGGLIGTIITIKDSAITMRSGESKVKLRKSNVAEVLSRTSSAATPKDADSENK